jgi:hypothetical protein
MRGYGGNLLALIYPNLRQPSAEGARPTVEDLDRAVTFLADGEDLLLRRGAIRSHHAVAIARRRDVGR